MFDAPSRVHSVLTIKPTGLQPFSTTEQFLVACGQWPVKRIAQTFMAYSIDQQTMLLFQQGDEKAFELVFRAYYTQLVVFTTKITGSQDEAEDIVTEVFLALFKRCNLFDSEPNIRAFLYVSARNRCLNYLKSKKRHDVRSLAFAEEIKDDTLLEYEYSIMS